MFRFLRLSTGSLTAKIKTILDRKNKQDVKPELYKDGNKRPHPGGQVHQGVRGGPGNEPQHGFKSLPATCCWKMPRKRTKTTLTPPVIWGLKHQIRSAPTNSLRRVVKEARVPRELVRQVVREAGWQSSP